MMEPTLLQRIDNYRFAERLGSRATAIRKLVESGLEAKGAAETAISPRHDHATRLEGNGNEYAKR